MIGIWSCALKGVKQKKIPGGAFFKVIEINKIYGYLLTKYVLCPSITNLVHLEVYIKVFWAAHAKARFEKLYRILHR